MNPDDTNHANDPFNINHNPSSTLAGDGQRELESSDFLLDEVPQPLFVKATTRYEILNEVGRGGMGIVYRAQDWQLHRHVAIKILRPEYIDRPHLVHRFLNEARIMGTLQHPGIAHVYECGFCEDGRPFHAMMLVTGETLNSMLNTTTIDPINKYLALNIFSQVCQAVAYAHSRGIAHLDLKPANVMVGEFGEVYLMDWGLAKHEGITDYFSHDDVLIDHPVNQETVLAKAQGTLEYMSPEQARGENLDQRTDVFCLGAMLYQVLTGRTIYQGSDRLALVGCAAAADLTDAFKVLDRCGNEHPLIRLTKRCLSANPGQRPSDASALANELSAHHATNLEIAQSDMSRFFELSLDLFCIAGFDGFFRRINSNFSRVLGLSDHELLSRPFLDFVHKDDQTKTMQVMRVLLTGQPVVRFRNRYLTAGGVYLEFEWTAKSIISEGIIFAVARNLSELSNE